MAGKPGFQPRASNGRTHAVSIPLDCLLPWETESAQFRRTHSQTYASHARHRVVGLLAASPSLTCPIPFSNTPLLSWGWSRPLFPIWPTSLRRPCQYGPPGPEASAPSTPPHQSPPAAGWQVCQMRPWGWTLPFLHCISLNYQSPATLGFHTSCWG